MTSALQKVDDHDSKLQSPSSTTPIDARCSRNSDIASKVREEVKLFSREGKRFVPYDMFTLPIPIPKRQVSEALPQQSENIPSGQPLKKANLNEASSPAILSSPPSIPVKASSPAILSSPPSIPVKASTPAILSSPPGMAVSGASTSRVNPLSAGSPESLEHIASWALEHKRNFVGLSKELEDLKGEMRGMEDLKVKIARLEEEVGRERSARLAVEKELSVERAAHARSMGALKVEKQKTAQVLRVLVPEGFRLPQ